MFTVLENVVSGKSRLKLDIGFVVIRSHVQARTFLSVSPSIFRNFGTRLRLKYAEKM